jgi:hypothetical protein
MTRDEAVAKCAGIADLYRIDAFAHAHAFVDLFEALGMLKLDKPKDKFQTICGVLTDWRSADVEGANAFMNRLEAAGLTIVEK